MLSARRLHRFAARWHKQQQHRAALSSSRAKSTKSWVPIRQQSLEMVTTQSIIFDMEEAHRKTARAVVPWFLHNMPSAYFRQIGNDLRQEHLRMFAAMHSADSPPSISLAHQGEERKFSFMRPSNSPGILLDNLDELPSSEQLTQATVFTSLDDKFCVNVFGFGKRAPYEHLSAGSSPEMKRFLEYVAELRQGQYANDAMHASTEGTCLANDEELLRMLAKCPKDYVLLSSPRRLARQLAMAGSVSGTEGIQAHLERWEPNQPPSGAPSMSSSSGLGEQSQFMITVASPNVATKQALRKIVAYCGANLLDITRAHVDVLSDGDHGHIDMVRLAVSPRGTGTANAGAVPTSTSAIFNEKNETDSSITRTSSRRGNDDLAPGFCWDTLLSDICRLKWIDNAALDMVGTGAGIDLLTAETIVALSGLVHCNLNYQSASASGGGVGHILSRAHVLRTLQNNLGLTTRVAQLFLDRHNPDSPMSDVDFAASSAQISTDVHAILQLQGNRLIFDSLLEGVGAVLRTNVHVSDRHSLACRLDPKFSKTNVHTDTPYGVFFVHGRRFNGFHVRFRDIARGGLRLLAPPNAEQYGMDSVSLYDEVYGLSRAQQLKNKDIPEGGSKAVCLIDVSEEGPATRDLILRRCCKAFADGLLCLISPDPKLQERMVDYYGQPEILYLGPDENVIPYDIEYIIRRAAERSYPIPAAFMSSKADMGINHKEYGVTSEGVQVFLDTALKKTGVVGPDSKPFSVKLSGGPDGDVCGNAIKIMNREYGDAVRIVGIADGSGCGEDPAGLDMAELLRLVEASLPIADFNVSKLSSEGVITGVDSSDGRRLRNTMHNRVKSDAFIPAGGRPGTINAGNWKDFFGADGKPSSPVVVEGANLFVEPVARRHLSENGVMIVKDSSANKCGVICSSYEIVASMMLSKEEFVGRKEELVTDVLKQLRELARLEAELLFKEADSAAKSDSFADLPAISERISAAITRAHDAVAGSMDSVPEERRGPLVEALVREHLPASLVGLAIDENRLYDYVPWAYVKNMAAGSLAARMVYNEGLDYIEALGDNQLVDSAFRYFDARRDVSDLLDTLEDSRGAALDDATVDELTRILKVAGVRAKLQMPE